MDEFDAVVARFAVPGPMELVDELLARSRLASAVSPSVIEGHVGAKADAGAPLTFGVDVAATLNTVTGDPTVHAELSEGAKLALDLSITSIGSLAEGGVSKATAAAKDELVGLGMQLAVKALSSALQAAGAAANVVPFVGQLVSMGIAIYEAATKYSARGTGRSVDEQRSYCGRTVQDGGWIEPVVPSAATGPVPADYFINGRVGAWPDGSPKYSYTTLGWSLMAATESAGEADAKSYYGARGLPYERRLLYKKLRRAICACRENAKPGSPHTRPGSDGGVTLWIAYVDMLRADLAAKRLTPGLCQYLMILNFAAMEHQAPSEDFPWGGYAEDPFGRANRDVARLLYSERSWGEGTGLDAAQKYAEDPIEDVGWFSPCELWTGSGQRALFGFVDNWNLTLDPFYLQEHKLADTAREALDALLEEQGVRPLARAQLAGALRNLQHRGATSPAKVLGWGAAVVALGLLLLGWW